MEFHIYKDKKGKWGWEAVKGDKVVAQSGQTWASKGSAKKALNTFKLGTLRAEVVED